MQSKTTKQLCWLRSKSLYVVYFFISSKCQQLAYLSRLVSNYYIMLPDSMVRVGCLS